MGKLTVAVLGEGEEEVQMALHGTAYTYRIYIAEKVRERFGILVCHIVLSTT